MEEKDKKEDLLEEGMDIIDQAPEQAIDASQESVEVPQEEIPQLSKEETLLQELNATREKYNREIEEARSDDNTSKLIAQLGPALAQYVTGGMQASSGANINTPQFKGIDPSMFDSSSNLINKKKEDLEAKLQEFRMLNPKKDIRTLGNRVVEISPDGEVETLLDAPGMSEKDEAQLQLKNRELDLKEKALADKPEQLSEFQKTMDREFAKKANKYQDDRGTISVNREKISGVLDKLKSGKLKTGFMEGRQSALGELVGYKTEVMESKDEIRSAIQEMLRPILGGQFAEKEGERIIKVAFDPARSTEANKNALEDELKKIDNRINSFERRANWVKDRGTLKGYDFSDSEIQDVTYGLEEQNSSQETKKDAKIEDYAKKYKLDYSKAEEILKRRGYGG